MPPTIVALARRGQPRAPIGAPRVSASIVVRLLRPRRLDNHGGRPKVAIPWKTEVRVMADFDVVVRRGTIADGSGGDLFEGDVAISDGRIAQVGTVPGTGAEEIDAGGLLVTPGFVDIHTHYDGQIT